MPCIVRPNAIFHRQYEAAKNVIYILNSLCCCLCVHRKSCNLTKETAAFSIGGLPEQSHPSADRTALGSSVSHLVEVTGIEPVSESALTETSPGAGGHLHSLVQAQADMLKDLVAS